MDRNIGQFNETTYDLVVVGAGVTGAATAWDAAKRGLKVALLERGDFGHATSANSMKTVHGGLRYLQDADLRLVRKMIRERRSLMQIAPHLVHPLPFMMPTTPLSEKLMRSRPLMQAAMKVNDIVSFDRNRIGDPQKELPNGRAIGRGEIKDLLPGLEEKYTGAVIWYDAQIYNTERLLLAFVQSAQRTGAHVANYMQVEDFLKAHDRVVGVVARDRLTGETVRIQAKMVVNAAGAWIDSLLGDLHQGPRLFNMSVAVNLVTRQVLADYGVGVQSKLDVPQPDGTNKRISNMLVFVPWREYSIVGTFHFPYHGDPDDFQLTEDQIQLFLDEANTAYPSANLTREDVKFVHRGFLPMEDPEAEHVSLVREGQIVDHEEADGVAGLISAVGVKWTTGRYMGKRTVDLVYKKLGQTAPACVTDRTPLVGGHITRFFDYIERQTEHAPDGISAAVIRHLVYNYGSEYRRVLAYLEFEPHLARMLPGTDAVIGAEVVHAVRQEMAVKLADVVLRRIEIGSASYPGDETVQAVADLMAVELGWDVDQKVAEIAEAKAIYNRDHAVAAMA